MRALLPLAFLLPACGTQVTVDHKPATTGSPSYSAPDELRPVVEGYLRACAETGVRCSIYHLSIRVGDTGPKRAGYCEISWDGNGRMRQEIVIRPDYKHNKQVLYHELEHCTRFQEHTEGDTPHIMRPYAMSDEELAKRPMGQWLKESLLRNVRFEGYEDK